MNAVQTTNRRNQTLGVITAILISLIVYWLSMNAIVAFVVAIFSILLVITTKGDGASSAVKVAFYSNFFLPQALSIFTDALDVRTALIWIEPSYILSEYNPFIGLKKSLLYLHEMDLFPRVVSIQTASQLSLLIMLACIPTILLWGMAPAVASKSSARSLKRLVMTFGGVYIIFAIVSFLLPLHSSSDCMLRCSNIDESNFPRLNILLFSQSMLIVLLFLIVKTYTTAHLRSRHV